jgi:metal-responsive CopG/Arc/MetJ family transcriptional regulator
MRTIQMTIDEPLLCKVDDAAQKLNVARSAFIRDAIARALEEIEERELERQHAEGYARIPPDDREVAAWSAVQDISHLAWDEPANEPG